MAMPDYAKITGKTIAHVEVEEERFQREDDVQDQHQLPTTLTLHCTDGSALAVSLGGEGAGIDHWIDWEWQPAKKEKTAAKKTAAEKKKK